MKRAKRVVAPGAAVLAVLVVLLMGVSAGVSAEGAAAAAEPINRVVLRVNSEIATLFDYEDRKSDRLGSIGEAQGLSTEERRRLAGEAGKATMREIFDEMLVLSRARQLRLNPTSGQIDAAVESTRKRMGLESQSEFEAALAQSGLTMATFRERMEKNLAFNDVLQREVQSKVKVEDDVVLRLYRDQAERWKTAERRRIEEAVVREDSGRSATERQALADELARAIAGGEAMAAAIERLGAGAVSGPVDLGWVVKGELAPALDAAIWPLGAGQVSAPVEGRGGLHVLRVAEVDLAKSRPFDEVKDEIRSEEGQRRFETETRKFLADLERQAYVVENIPEDAVGYRESLPEDPEAAGVLGEFAPVRGQAAAPEPAPTAAPAAALPATTETPAAEATPPPPSR
jgi:peptidyl-prolyl cis-trans isomerase C